MSNYTATEPGRSLGTIIKELTADFSTLFRSEVALLKLEVRDTVAKLIDGFSLRGLLTGMCILNYTHLMKP